MSGVTPAVSVLLPTYQRSLWLRQAVDSVLAQRFEDFELIVVDDGSTDGTEEALTIADKRLRYHRQAHGGASSAQNTALSLARAPIVALLNSDDLWRPNHLATVCDALDRFPEAVLAVTRRWPTDKSHLWAREGALVDLLPRLVVTNPLGQPSSVAARRPIALEVGGFDERLLVSGDFDFFLRIAMRGPFCLVHRNTSVKRRVRTRSASGDSVVTPFSSPASGSFAGRSPRSRLTARTQTSSPSALGRRWRSMRRFVRCESRTPMPPAPRSEKPARACPSCRPTPRSSSLGWHSSPPAERIGRHIWSASRPRGRIRGPSPPSSCAATPPCWWRKSAAFGMRRL